jgi:hypothetical protein
MSGVWLTDDEARAVRAAAETVLRLVADPDQVVHAEELDEEAEPTPDHKGRGQRVRRATLCHRGGNAPRLTRDPKAVTCAACKASVEWDFWRWGDR